MSLSADQQGAYEQLLAITASASAAAQERDLAILSETNWDVQAALEVIFSGQAEEPTTNPAASSSASGRPADGPASSSSSSSGLPYSRFSVEDSDQRRPVSERGATPASPGQPGGRRSAGLRIPRGLRGVTRVGLGLGWTLYSIILWPVQVIFGLVIGGWSWFYRLIPQPVAALLPTFLTPAQASIDAPGASRRREPAALRFLRSLEALTDARSSSSVGARDTPNTNGTDARASKEQRDSDAEELELPDFHTGGYKEALEQAKRQGRIVLIGLFSDIHQDDAQWKRTVLTDPLLVNTLRKHNVVFWAGDVKDREPYQVTRLLPPTTFPSLTFISLLPSSRGSGSSSSGSMKLSVLSRHEGPTVTAAELTTHLEQSIVPRTTAILNRIQRETRQREEERRLRQEQDRAFEDSQTRDVARILKLREERAQQEALERAEADRKRELELAKQRAEAQARVRLAYLRFARSTLLPTEPPLDDTLASSIALRLPPTPRPFKRRFPASTPLEVLYLWADTLTIPADLPAAGDPAEPPTDGDLAGQPYRHEFAFKLATSYPRRVLDTSDGDRTIGGSPILKAGAGVLVFEATEGSGSHAADDDDDSSDDDEDEA